MSVISSRLDILVEPCHCVGGPCPCARLRPGGAVIKIVIDSCGRPVSFDLRFVQRDKAARSRIDYIVFENIVCHVPLHLEFAGACCRCSFSTERIVDHRRMIGMPPVRRITPDGNTCSVAVIDKVVSSRDVTRGTVFMLTGQFDSKVHIVHHVLFDQDSVPPST